MPRTAIMSANLIEILPADTGINIDCYGRTNCKFLEEQCSLTIEPKWNEMKWRRVNFFLDQKTLSGSRTELKLQSKSSLMNWIFKWPLAGNFVWEMWAWMRFYLKRRKPVRGDQPTLLLIAIGTREFDGMDVCRLHVDADDAMQSKGKTL